ncbi:lipoyltransferase [Luminiphilus syltensis NOR5-1B]|uniref:Octanoyltransferase n=1 Tax=Luminiphilus syltensis NOR5-1B TaxID=565045 RepID=B8KSL5_9GAMM|nr:lipoyl(octanoyl) transferase LipB [Luminiphilus syltensis]EED36461.1 lipoyltransferase [Luminiphilus syltensis NOR5-1B]
MKLRRLGLVEYPSVFEQMKAFTKAREADAEDELWLLQHPPVFTQGISGKEEHILAPGDIPVIQIDRGGQVTYHGPGQWVVYLLIDIRRAGIGVRQLVTLIEGSVIDLLAGFGIKAEADPKAPGVYVNGAKIAALGLKVSKGCSYHGVSLNVDMDLEPFQRINPCGYQGLAVTSVRQEIGSEIPTLPVVGEALLTALADGVAAAVAR